jgi:hypothetical protein
METLLPVFIGMMLVFLAESCQGDRIQGQQSVLKIVKSSVELHLVWHDAGCCVLLRVPVEERPRQSKGPTPQCTNITTVIFL